MRHVPLCLNGSALNQTKSCKFLGINIDENLSWKKHIDVLTTRISTNVGIMNRLKYFLPQKILLTLYNAFILSYLNYAILSWGHGKALCNKLLLLQKKAVRIITKANYLSHSAPIFAELKVLKFNDLYCLNLGKFMFKNKYRLLPNSFNEMFTLASSIHSYGTRKALKGDLYVNHNRTSIHKNSVVQRGVEYWNSLPIHFKQPSTISTFSRKLKHYLLDTYL